MKKTVRRQELAVVRTAVFLTPTTVGMGMYQTGMQKSVFENNRQAFVLQGFMPIELFATCKAGAEEYVRGAIEELFYELFNQPSVIDHLVAYIGNRGIETAIMLAAKFPHEKLTLAMCPCNVYRKVDAMADARLKGIKIVRSECGGWVTMESLFHGFMDTGVPTLKRAGTWKDS